MVLCPLKEHSRDCTYVSGAFVEVQFFFWSTSFLIHLHYHHQWSLFATDISDSIKTHFKYAIGAFLKVAKY